MGFRPVFAMACAIVAFTACGAVDFAPVLELAARTDVRLAALLKFEALPSAPSGAAAVVEPSEDGVGIRICAASAGDACFALGCYMRDVAKADISWCGSRIPSEWPVPGKRLEYRPAVPVRLAYNYCTLSYTAAFWTKREWRKEIDRLALTGFNAALVLNGLTQVWRETLEASGRFQESEIDAFMADDAARAWWHMGNLAGLGGPLSREDCAADAELGRWIYAEMKKLGIEPVVQGYVGFLPPRSGFDGAIVQGTWNGLPRPDVLSPTAPAFDEMSRFWFDAVKRVYATGAAGLPKYLAGDLFHEGGNAEGLSRDDLAAIARKIHASHALHIGRDATWVLQSWQGTPLQGIRDGLDENRSLIQYLDKDMSGSGPCKARFFKEWRDEAGALHRTPLPWIWCEVLNFGGNPGLHGGARRFRSIARVGADPETAGSFRGYGMLSEGLGTNAAMYDMFFSAFSRPVGSPDLEGSLFDGWLGDYIVRRYGACDASLVQAYRALFASAWNCSRPNQEGCVENILCAFPSYDVKNVSTWGPKTGIEYDPAVVRGAARHFLAALRANPQLEELETFRFDFCELFLQVLAERARAINAECRTSAERRKEFLSLVDIADALLASSPAWRLDSQEAPARSHGARGVLGYRRMLTNWTGSFDGGASSGLRDYSHRALSGMMEGYCKARWERFFALTEGALDEGKYVECLRALDEDFMLGARKCLVPVAHPLDEIGRAVLSVTETR